MGDTSGLLTEGKKQSSTETQGGKEVDTEGDTKQGKKEGNTK